MSRDPIEEEGGEALYAFCSNGSQGVFDVLGLRWFVWRDGAPWALAYRTEPAADTLEVLAKQVGFDEREAGRLFRPTAETDCPVWYSVPNRVYILYEGSPDRGRLDEYVDEVVWHRFYLLPGLWQRGFEVRTVHSATTADLTGALSDTATHGVVLVGHGPAFQAWDVGRIRGPVTPRQVGRRNRRPGTGPADIRVHPVRASEALVDLDHGLAFLDYYGCQTATSGIYDQEVPWTALVSRNGRLLGFAGLVHPLTDYVRRSHHILLPGTYRP
jgi:hypothetical protein